MPVPKFYFEDFKPGLFGEYGPRLITREEIVAFAAEFDPQPMHLDEDAARDTMLGGLAASGWHTCGVMMRMLCDGFLLDSSSMGANAIDEVKWLKPVRPGARLTLRVTILETRASKSRPEMGFVTTLSEMIDQTGACVMSLKNPLIFGNTSRRRAMKYFEEYQVGDHVALGSHRFEVDEIKAFARRFDPQRFHVDEAEAERSHFGKLCASGWHTVFLWMRAQVTYRRREADARSARGEKIAKIGPSPGFRDLKWTRPVYAGDTISFATEVVEARLSNSRPDSGILHMRNTGTNQNGDLVISFVSATFVERRPIS